MVETQKFPPAFAGGGGSNKAIQAITINVNQNTEFRQLGGSNTCKPVPKNAFSVEVSRKWI